jgi:hypothetical protein
MQCPAKQSMRNVRSPSSADLVHISLIAWCTALLRRSKEADGSNMRTYDMPPLHSTSLIPQTDYYSKQFRDSRPIHAAHMNNDMQTSASKTATAT